METRGLFLSLCGRVPALHLLIPAALTLLVSASVSPNLCLSLSTTGETPVSQVKLILKHFFLISEGHHKFPKKINRIETEEPSDVEADLRFPWPLGEEMVMFLLRRI